MGAQPAPARKGRCKTVYRLKTPAEMGITDPDPWHVMFGGRTTTKVLLSIYSPSGDLIELVFPEDQISVTADYYETFADHEWLDTDGMLRSYCKHCDARGEWNRAKLAYVAIDKEPDPERDLKAERDEARAGWFTLTP